MMNVLSLGFVLTSLLVAQVWSPPGSYKQHQQENLNQVNANDGDHVILTHRVVVVETYDQKTIPVSTSKDKDSTSENGGGGAGVGELICDSFGKCKDKIGRVIDKAKEGAFKAKENVKEDAHEAKNKVEDMYEKEKQTVKDKTHKGKEKIEHVYETGKDSASQITQEARGVIEKAKGEVRHKAQDVKKRAKESLQKAKETGKDATDKVTEKAKRIVSETLKCVGGIKGVSFLMGMLHLLGFATAYGTCVWVTFVSSYVLGGILPRHQFGLVQTKIYPVYFRAMATSILVALLGYLGVKQDKLLDNRVEVLQGFNLMASVFLVLINSQYLEPLATEAMFERFKLEKEEGRGRDQVHTESTVVEEPRQPGTVPVTTATTTTTTTTTSTAAGVEPGRAETREAEGIRSKLAKTSNRLNRLNCYSSILNLMNLVSLTWHLVYIGQCLHSPPSTT